MNFSKVLCVLLVISWERMSWAMQALLKILPGVFNTVKERFIILLVKFAGNIVLKESCKIPMMTE